MKNSNKHVVVISEDAMIFEDTALLRELPVFGGLWDQMARVERVRSIYPSLTYPCHATMMTGCYPDRHGVVNNLLTGHLEPNSPWNWFYSAVQVPSLFDAAKAEGLTTASVFWPVTGGCKSIDYLLAEYWPQHPEETMAQCFLHSGTSPEVLDACIRPNLWMQVNRTHPFCDDFIMACACSMLRQYQPNLLMVHPTNLDGYRHEQGVFSSKLNHGLHEIDHWLGWILQAARDAGIYEQTNFFIISDHGQLNTDRMVCLNVEFVRRGLIQLDSRGQISDYTAFVQPSGTSAQVILKDPASFASVRQVLDELCRSGTFGISRVWSRPELQEKEHLSGPFSFVLETDGHTFFGSDWTGPLMRSFSDSSRPLRGNHGHHPDTGPQPTLLAFGPSIRPGAVLSHGALVDEAPTIARMLGLELPYADGEPMMELLR